MQITIPTNTIKTITNNEDLKTAVDYLSTYNSINDKLQEEKNKVMRPLLDAVQAERKRWKSVEDELEEKITTLRSLISKYQTEQKKLIEEKENKITARIGEGKGKIKIETAIAQIEKNKIEEKIVTNSGSVKFRTIQKFEITNIELLPKEYLLPNETAIREAMKKDVKLPGVRYYEEEQVINNR